MKQETATALCAALKSLDAEHSHRTDYSGRGMYGKTTHAVVCDSNTLYAACAMAGADIAANLASAQAWADRLDKDDIAYGNAVDEAKAAQYRVADFLEDLKFLRVDSMGHQVVLY